MSVSCGRRKYAALAPAPTPTPTVTMANRGRSKIFMDSAKAAGLSLGDINDALLGILWSGL